MAASVSLINHGTFQPAWTPAHKPREIQKTPVHITARKRSANTHLPMEYIDPGRAELRSVLVRTHAVMHRTKSGQDYEKAVKVVNSEFWKPPKAVCGDWFPEVGEVFDLTKENVDATRVSHFCDMLEQMPFLFKALDRIRISWLRNNYPLPLRIVRALDRDDFELISSNFPGPISDVNRHPGAMWTMSTGDAPMSPRKSQPRQLGRRDTVARASRPLERGALIADPTAVPKSVIAHRRDWNRLIHRCMDDCVTSPEAGVTSLEAGQQRLGSGAPSALGEEGGLAAARRRSPLEQEHASVTSHPDRPLSRLLEPLHPAWQLVQEAEQGDQRVSNLNTVSAEDAKLIMKRCQQLKSKALGLMDQQYKAKIHKLEDNRSQRYRRKVAYLVPPYRTADADMPAIRRRVQRRSRLEDVTLRSAAWYGRLLRLAERLGAADREPCRQLLANLLPFSRREGSQTVRGGEKLCLLLMSVPMYEALRAGLQMAVLFVHVHFLGGSENVFRRWLEARRLTDATSSSPLISLIRGETATEEDTSSSEGES